MLQMSALRQHQTTVNVVSQQSCALFGPSLAQVLLCQQLLATDAHQVYEQILPHHALLHPLHIYAPAENSDEGIRSTLSCCLIMVDWS